MPVTVACLSVPGPGTYAIAIYHDENGDRKFDRSMLGLPEEGYGFSNNAAVVLAPPSFDAVKFKAADGVTHVDITMRYRSEERSVGKEGVSPCSSRWAPFQ